MTVLVAADRIPADALAGLDVVREPGPDVEAVLLMHEVRFGAAEMDALPALRAVVTGSVGYDHIDVAAAAERGVWVCNVPDYCVDEVADHTLALLLALMRGLVPLHRDVQRGAWNALAAGPLRTLAGLPVGIVGYGRIGSAVGRRLAAVGCELLVNDVRDVGVPLVPLDELLRESEAVTLHVPLTAETNGLIGAQELARMRPGALLVNTCRGAVVELEPLVQALRDGSIGGAALDVLPEEPPASVPDLPNLLVTPHAAWYGEDAERKAYAGAVAAALAASRGERPASAVPETP
jgi:D-3-phosphoglycerate dehydrogenase / 2-oxoglutarate reductase